MCFSATASFVGGTVISSIGIAAISMNKVPSQRLFAAIPVFFGIQQISEGFVWLALPPLFISGREGVFFFGIVIAISYIFTRFFYEEYLLSVWCFFAALGSIIVWLVVTNRRIRHK